MAIQMSQPTSKSPFRLAVYNQAVDSGKLVWQQADKGKRRQLI
jgi:hypothetical protein